MKVLYTLLIIATIILFFIIKNILWDKPRKEIKNLKCDIDKLQKLHKEELSCLQTRLENSNSLHIQKNEFMDIIVSFYWRELSDLCNKEFAFLGVPRDFSIFNDNKIPDSIKHRFREAINEQYKYKYLIFLYPELAKIFDGTTVKSHILGQPTTITVRNENLFGVVNILKSNPNKSKEMIYWKNRATFLEASKSNLKAIPYMAGIMADYETYGIERLAKELDWGYSQKRMDKVKAIREIRKDAQAIVEKNKEAQYQLAYLLNLFPTLEDVIDTEFNQLPTININELSEYDSAKDYLSKEEYAKLNEIERNQLALDRYKNSRNRTKWQIGRDYELYVGYRYSQKGYDVDYFGSYMGLEDLGRDIIAKRNNEVLIIQCKYWSSKKQIHEKHINQLYGTMICYCIEHNVDKSNVRGILVTNIELSPTAKKNGIVSWRGIC